MYRIKEQLPGHDGQKSAEKKKNCPSSMTLFKRKGKIDMLHSFPLRSGSRKEANINILTMFYSLAFYHTS
ncbi:hypothetical protein AB5I83_13805 [Mesobacillus sp. LC4]